MRQVGTVSDVVVSRPVMGKKLALSGRAGS